jgi:hypothetical protein
MKLYNQFANANNPNVERVSIGDFTEFLELRYGKCELIDDFVMKYFNHAGEIVAWFDIENAWGFIKE